MIRAILVDDRESHLSLLKNGLALFKNDIEIIGTFTNPELAMAEIIHHRPDVLFLDIEMPGRSGFELAAAVKDICSNVIFLTNYMQYGPDSYSYNAIYFIDKERLELFLPEAIARLKAKFSRAYKGDMQPVLPPFSILPAPVFRLKHIFLSGPRKVFITLVDGKNEIRKELELRAESYHTLSKFILFKLIAEKLKEPGSAFISQKKDPELFINLSQSRKHFMKDVNAQLAVDGIELTSEDFFVNIFGGAYVFSLGLDEIAWPPDQKLLENWVNGWIGPVIEKKHWMINCLIKNGELDIRRVQPGGH